MKQSLLFISIAVLCFTSAASQQTHTIEFSTAFPINVFQNSQREYFMTTKYSAAFTWKVQTYASVVTTLSYTQQQAMFMQRRNPLYDYGALSANGTIRIPFTTEPFFGEYGIFSGVRLYTEENEMQAFVQAQLGTLAMKYGAIDYVAYQPEDPMPGGPDIKEVEGTVFKVQMAASYGAGLLWHPVSPLTIFADLHVVKRLTKQPLDVYRSIGIQIGF